MNLYYVCPLKNAQALKCEWHGVDLENGHWLIAVRWRNEVEEIEFTKDPEVSALPHPVFEADTQLDDAHHDKLKDQFPLQRGHNIHHLLKHAVKRSPAFRLRVL